MDKIKRFLDCYIPTETCNLRCHYCYITQKRKFCSQIAAFSRPVETMVKALSRERLGGPCLLNLCAGGETLLSGEVLPLAKALIGEGHYVMLVTNGTVTRRFAEIAAWPEEARQHLFIKFSFHYLELLRLGWMDRFFENVALMKERGVSFTVEITPSDALMDHIEAVKHVCMERLGALCHVTIARDDRTAGIDVLSELDFKTYKRVWGQFDSELFLFKTEIFKKKRNEFCYAGDWSGYLNLETGELRQCYCGKKLCNIYENIIQPINFEAIGRKCTLAYCYNGHAYLALGNIPELRTPIYAQLRDRACDDGSHWLTPQMAAFMGTKLAESNREYTPREKSRLEGHVPGYRLRGWLSRFRFYQALHRWKERL